MKKISNCFLLLLFVAFSEAVPAQVMWQVSGDKVVQWYYLDGDEFSGAGIDTTKWQNSFPWGRNLYCNREQQYYSDWKNHRIGNGVLRLEVRKEKVTEKAVVWEAEQTEMKCGEVNTGPNKRLFEYTSGMIFSKNKYHYGYYEMRFKSSSGKGLWPAFWLYGGHESDEIDIFELKGERNSDLHVDVHCSSGCNNYKTTLGLLRKNWGDYLRASSGWHEGYNVVSIEWRPGYIKWFLNGKGIAYWKGKLEFPMWIIANLAIPSDIGPFGPGPDAGTFFPATFEIDYIRIWSLTPPVRKQQVNLQNNVATDARSKIAAPVGKKRPEYKKANLKQETVMATFAKISEEELLVAFNGLPGDGFSLEVTDGSGKIAYQSKDGTAREHVIRKNTAGNYILKMNIKGKLLQHKF